MKKRINILLITALLSSCSLIQGYDNFVLKNQFGRTQLKPKNIKLDKSFDSSKINIVDTDAIYFYRSEDTAINMEFNLIMRFFSTGQFALFGGNQKPIIGLSYDNYQYNNLSRASVVGYYNINDSVITVEYPNHLFRRAGRRNLDEYRILPNGNLESITREASDYEAVYKKILATEKGILPVEPDW